MATRVIRDASVSRLLHELTVIALSTWLVIVEPFATMLIVGLGGWRERSTPPGQQPYIRIGRCFAPALSPRSNSVADRR